MIKQYALLLLAIAAQTTIAAAQESAPAYEVIHETDTVWHFGAESIFLYSRPMHRIDIAYPSKDPEGNDATLSGCIAIPTDVLNGEQPCDGVVLMNHYTQMSFDGAPTRGNAQGEDYVFANPLSPNYIQVSSDFYGFGITEGKGQWYCFGDANAQASIDCLLAARKLLDDREISQGRFLINAGYSSGGYDAIATQKLRDMKYRDVISFDKTFVGGLPFDMETAFDDYLAIKDQPGRFFGLLMVLDSYNRHAHLGLKTEEMLKEPWASKFDEWMNSGQYRTSDILDELRHLKLTDIVKDTMLNKNSEAHKKLRQALKDHELKNDWVPDTTQNYLVMHLYSDMTVPVASDRALLTFLSGYRYENGTSPLFRKSIIPEQTHLQTNFIINSKDHTLLGGACYYLGLSAMLTALPIIYYDGELNTHYADLVKDATPMGIVNTLEAKGYDLKSAIKGMGGGGGDIWSAMAKITEITKTLDRYLEPHDLVYTDLLTMADDSGLTLQDILEIYTYLSSDDSTDAGSRQEKTSATQQPQVVPGTPSFFYQQLENWLHENKFDIESIQLPF